MGGRSIALVAVVLLMACTPAAAPSASGSASATSAASSQSPSASASGKQIALQVVAPEEGARAGVEGSGWTVDILATGGGPAMDRIKPTFRMSTNSGKNTAFPGLVVIVRQVGASSTTTNASGSPVPSALPNLAGMFQIVGLPNTQGGVAGISSVSASASPSASAAARTTATDNQTAQAAWFVLQSMWGTNVDVELTALVIDGDAPDTVTDLAQLKAVSNTVTVRFHINGSGVAPSSTVRPSASGSVAPSASPSGSPRPSASASATP